MALMTNELMQFDSYGVPHAVNGQYVRLVNNQTGETQISVAAAANGYFTITRPSAGNYHVWLGLTSTGPWIDGGIDIDVTAIAVWTLAWSSLLRAVSAGIVNGIASYTTPNDGQTHRWMAVGHQVTASAVGGNLDVVCTFGGASNAGNGAVVTVGGTSGNRSFTFAGLADPNTTIVLNQFQALTGGSGTVSIELWVI